ncbi:hypothetical protein LCGC14_2972980, partial [marine sediment metagenome]
GFTDYISNKITLASKEARRTISKDEIDITFIHEVIHFILQKTKYPDLNNDEQFVTLMARALHQVLTTIKY